MNLLDWSPPQPADLIDLADPGALQFLLDRYGGSNPDVLQSILAQVFDAGARMTVIEYRYLDPHYRDEHSRVLLQDIPEVSVRRAPRPLLP